MANLNIIDGPGVDLTDLDLTVEIGLTGNINIDIGKDMYLSMSPLEARQLLENLRGIISEYVERLK